jgi:EpsI family protein
LEQFILFKQKSAHLLFVASFTLFLCANLSSLLAIFDEWNSDGPYSHGFLGILVVGYVFWVKRKSIVTSDIPPLSFIISLVGLLGSLSVHFVALLSSIQQLQQLALYFIILFLFSAFYGFKTLKAVALPFIMLFLIFPVWNILQFPLRELSTAAGQWGPELMGISVGRDGYRLSTPGGLFDVEPACSGLGFFMVSALLAFFVSFFNKLSTKKTFVFLLICLAVAVLANWLRVIIIIVVGTYTEMNHFIVHDHLTFGWIVFALCLLPLIYIARNYFDDSAIDKVQTDTAPKNKITAVSTAQVTTIFSVMIAFIVAAYWIPSRFNENYALTAPSLNNYVMSSDSKSYSPNWKPYSQGASQERFFYYTQEALGFQVYLADYVKQEQASEMIYVENYVFDKEFWHLLEDGKLSLDGNQGLKEADLVLVQKTATRYRFIASWYVINGTLTSDKKYAKLLEVKATLAGQPGATLVAIAFDFDGQDKAGAQQHLSEFINSYLLSFSQ